MTSENKPYRVSGVLLCTFVVFACVSCTTKSAFRLQPVGPALFGASLDQVFSHEIGFLIVYSATEPRHLSKQLTSHPHTGYLIRTAEGSKFEWIDNSLDKTDETAMLVALPAGSYMVQAQTTQYGQVIVPVSIAPWRTTRVALEPSSSEAFEGINSTNLVHLPDGEIVGWRAKAGA